MNTIHLPSSTSQDALLQNILLASQTKAMLVLMPGPHLTKPGRHQRIKIGANGLYIQGSLGTGEYSSIKRPDMSVLSTSPDDNYGLFFIPDDPTDSELQAITNWQTHTNDDGTILHYSVIVRGAIRIENTEIDCNMGNQGLPFFGGNPPQKLNCEHACMLGFSGTHVDYNSGPYKGKRVYIAFQSVKLNDIRTINGGFADDIWISRGYFRPNIGTVSISNITSYNRVEKKRATIGFSGLAQHVDIRNATIYRLECEETSQIWREAIGLPFDPQNLNYSSWKLDNIICDIFDLAAKGQAIVLKANAIQVKKAINLYQLGGIIKNSVFNVGEGSERRLNRLNHMIFDRVKWILKPDETGKVMGIYPYAQYGESSIATFSKNEFIVDGDVTKGVLINSEYSTVEPQNKVDVLFKNCVYDSRFGSVAFPQTHIAFVDQRGHWTFKKSDFGAIPIDRAIQRQPAHTDVIVTYS